MVTLGLIDKERRYKIHYMNGDEEVLDPQRIICYSYLNGNKISGSNPPEEYIAGLLRNREPILLSEERFSSKIERIINTINIRNISSVEDFPCNFSD